LGGVVASSVASNEYKEVTSSQLLVLHSRPASQRPPRRNDDPNNTRPKSFPNGLRLLRLASRLRLRRTPLQQLLQRLWLQLCLQLWLRLWLLRLRLQRLCPLRMHLVLSLQQLFKAWFLAPRLQLPVECLVSRLNGWWDDLCVGW